MQRASMTEIDYEIIPREEFDDLARKEEFVDGPWISSFGDGPYDPYCPPSHRWVRGTLRDGRNVKAGPKEIK